MPKMFSELAHEIERELRAPAIDAKARLNQLVAALAQVERDLAGVASNTTALRTAVNTLATDEPNDRGVQALKALMDRYVQDGLAQHARAQALTAAIQAVEAP
jgi:hypothetical protein